MEIKITFEKPEGFSEWFSKTLAECVAQGIVERAIKELNDESIDKEQNGCQADSA